MSIYPKIFGPAGQIGDNKGGERKGGIKARISADGLMENRCGDVIFLNKHSFLGRTQYKR